MSNISGNSPITPRQPGGQPLGGTTDRTSPAPVSRSKDITSTSSFVRDSSPESPRVPSPAISLEPPEAVGPLSTSLAPKTYREGDHDVFAGTVVESTRQDGLGAPRFALQLSRGFTLQLESGEPMRVSKLYLSQGSTLPMGEQVLLHGKLAALRGGQDVPTRFPFLQYVTNIGAGEPPYVDGRFFSDVVEWNPLPTARVPQEWPLGEVQLVLDGDKIHVAQFGAAIGPGIDAFRGISATLPVRQPSEAERALDTSKLRRLDMAQGGDDRFSDLQVLIDPTTGLLVVMAGAEVQGVVQVEGHLEVGPSVGSKPLSQEKTEQVLRVFARLQKDGQVNDSEFRPWSTDAIPGGEDAYVKVWLERPTGGDMYSYQGLLAKGRDGDPNKALQLYVKRTGGIHGMPALAGPFPLALTRANAASIAELQKGQSVTLELGAHAGTAEAWNIKADAALGDMQTEVVHLTRRLGGPIVYQFTWQPSDPRVGEVYTISAEKVMVSGPREPVEALQFRLKFVE